MVNVGKDGIYRAVIDNREIEFPSLEAYYEYVEALEEND